MDNVIIRTMRMAARTSPGPFRKGCGSILNDGREDSVMSFQTAKTLSFQSSFVERRLALPALLFPKISAQVFKERKFREGGWDSKLHRGKDMARNPFVYCAT